MRLIIGLAAHRWWERFGQRRTKRRARIDGTSVRSATARKSTGLGGAFAAVGGGLLLLSSLLQGNLVVRAAVNSFSDQIVMEDYDSSWALNRVVDAGATEEVEIRALFAEHATSASEAELDSWTRRYLAEGAAGFRDRWDDAPWPAAGMDVGLRRTLALLFLWIGALSLLCNLGGSGRELGGSQWDLEWLWSLPVTSRTVFAARLLEHATLNPWIWFTVPALGLGTFRASGYGWLAAGGMALFCTLCLALIVGALHLLIETWMRTRVQHPKNVQAICSVLGLLMFFGLFALIRGEQLPAMIAAAGEAFRPLGNPLSLPAGLVAPEPGHAALAAAGLLLWALALPAAAIAISGAAARSGLQARPCTPSGTRGRTPTNTAARTPALRGVVGKDLRLLLRDRNLLVQSLVVPLIIIGFQFVAQRGLADAVTRDAGNLAALAFSVCAYLLMFCAMPILSVEGKALWMLYTFPQPLHRMLAAKVRLWAGIASLYGTATFVAGAALGARPGLADAARLALAMVAVPAYAFVAAGLGALSTDPFEQDPRRRVKPATAYLYFMVASGLGYALAKGSLWQVFVQCALACVLAMALWQKLRDRIHYLLDPTERPPPLLSASDGVFALMAFVLAQTLCSALFMLFGAPPRLAIPLSFALSGSVVAACALGILLHRKTPELFRLVGMERAAGDRHMPLVRSTAAGVLAGVAAGACGLLWLFALARIPGLRDWYGEQGKRGIDVHLGALLMIGVLAAPLFEELLFRGLLLRGFERSFGPGRALIASSILFAVVHPLVSVPTVLVLGIAAGRVFQRQGVLLAPIAAHATYNAIVMLVPKFWPALAG